MTEPDSAFASTAGLLGRIAGQLGAQLAHVRPYDRRQRKPDEEACPPMNVPALAGQGRALFATPAPAAPAPTLVAVGHGSRDPRARATLARLLDRVRELRPGLDVRLAHIELNAPLLDDTLAELAAEGRDVVLVPLLFAPGHHVTHDLPAAVAAATATAGAPALHARAADPRAADPFGASAFRARVADPLGAHPLLVEALADRLAEAGWTPDDTAATGVVLASAGSRDPRSGAVIRRIAVLLGERLGGVPVVPAYASAATPTVPAAVRALTARGRHRVAVASCFTAPGLFVTRAAADAPWIASDPLGAHPALARLVLHRYDRARTTLPVRELAAV
ncbi:sirohydrochlorin chelatase [Streptomyces sp. TLI_105]|uniref:sirohydrochlorin chelatase n=1 Tax=Streptomyces sp. TLI_105 TaxID=1881019 RepID=UPI0008953C49|nr:sirohydrochlorin chelatase [Streptomyces sp. TLI_105]SED42971.1 Sirohydrochlorin ferrochelatase [Streptomyces sp. TLI_105]